MRVVYTGFEAFGKHSYNPSWDVAEAAADRDGGAVDSVAELLPVDFDAVRSRAREWLRLADATEPPAAIVQFGLADTRTTVGLESRARNVRGGRPDEAGRAIEERSPLEPDAPSELTATAPVEELRRALERETRELEVPPVAVSEDAGEYVCNALYYYTLHAVRATDPERPPAILFVHVPPLEPAAARRLGRNVGDVIEEVLSGGEV